MTTRESSSSQEFAVELPSRDDEGPVELRVRRPDRYTLEILTEAEWRALGPEDLPDEFFFYKADCFVRFKPIPFRRPRREDD